MAAKPDLTEFFKYSRPKKKPCAIGFVLAQLDTAALAQLRAACEQDSGLITSAAVRQWLLARGHDVNVSAITSHRRGTCSCDAD